jgi:hypothetical protein
MRFIVSIPFLAGLDQFLICNFPRLLPISMNARSPMLSPLYAASRAQVTWVKS